MATEGDTILPSSDAMASANPQLVLLRGDKRNVLAMDERCPKRGRASAKESGTPEIEVRGCGEVSNLKLILVPRGTLFNYCGPEK